MSNASEWLTNLEEYECYTCGNHSIFKDQCSDCDTHESNIYRIKELRKNVNSIDKELQELRDKRVILILEKIELERYFKDKG